MRLVVLTGLSGAGKTQALHALEDIGYYCVDNLPPTLLQPMVELCLKDGRIQKAAVVMDSRGGILFGGIDNALEQMRKLNVDYQIIFLDAADEELARRYNETRRAHPFGQHEMIALTIREEREALQPLREGASRVIDTTRMLTRELRETMVRLFGDNVADYLHVSMMSFGFKRGAPQDADIVLDVRFLPNPHYIPEMRALTGLDKPVADYIGSFPETEQFIQKTHDLLAFLLPLYLREGKSRLVVAVGCTGGRHRSVYLTERIAEGFLDYNVSVSHRDIAVT